MAERTKDNGNADVKEVDHIGDNKMAIESNMSPTIEVESRGARRCFRN